MNLSTEMELPANRETVLHFFERVQKTYPAMRNFYSRDRGDFVLEEDKDQGTYRWCTIEPRRVCSGHVNPESIDEAMEQHRLILELAPLRLRSARWIARPSTSCSGSTSPIAATTTSCSPRPWA